MLATAAYAEGEIDRYFDALDVDGDGYVSLAEAAGDPVIVNRFDRADKNRDGKLSRKEFANLKKVKVRVAKKKEPGAAVGGSAPRKSGSDPKREKSGSEPKAAGG
jgi:EF hand